MTDAYRLGYQDGIEAAARLCDDHSRPPILDPYTQGWARCAQVLAKRIRALTPPAQSPLAREAAASVELDRDITHSACPRCGGTGALLAREEPYYATCERCRGTGVEP